MQVLQQGRIVLGFILVPPEAEDTGKSLVFCTMSQTEVNKVGEEKKWKRPVS